jgi:hypothetical protein
MPPYGLKALLFTCRRILDYPTEVGLEEPDTPVDPLETDK